MFPIAIVIQGCSGFVAILTPPISYEGGPILKSFKVVIIKTTRFCLVYNNASIVGKYPCKICKNFWTSFTKNEISGKSKKIRYLQNDSQVQKYQDFRHVLYGKHL